MQNYKDLRVWQESHSITLSIYKLTKSFPSHELYSLTSQIRRSAQSVPTNIAEGSVQSSGQGFKRFLYISLGSASECDYQLLLAKDLGYLSDNEFAILSLQIDKVKKQITRLIQAVER